MTERISVLMTVYNYERYVEAALASVLAQTRPADEILVLDDGSTDNSFSKVTQMAKQYPNIKAMHQENCGEIPTLTTLMQQATGDYVALLNADDCFYPDKLRLQLEALHNHPDWLAVFSFVQSVDSEDREIAFMHNIFNVHRSPEQIYRRFFLGNCLNMSSVLMRRQAMETCGHLHPGLNYTFDFDYWLRMSHMGNLGVIPQALVKARFHGGNKSLNIFYSAGETWRVVLAHLATGLVKDPKLNEQMGLILHTLGQLAQQAGELPQAAYFFEQKFQHCTGAREDLFYCLNALKQAELAEKSAQKH